MTSFGRQYIFSTLGCVSCIGSIKILQNELSTSLQWTIFLSVKHTGEKMLDLFGLVRGVTSLDCEQKWLGDLVKQILKETTKFLSES